MCPRARSARLLSHLFSTSKFPKLARQSSGDRAADVPPTMSSWALALHKREGTRETVARKGRRAKGARLRTHGGSTTQGTDLARRRLRVPHAPILQCTLLVCPLLPPSLPLSSLLLFLFLHLAALEPPRCAPRSSPFFSPITRFHSPSSRRRGASRRQIDDRPGIASRGTRLTRISSGPNLLCKEH